MRAITSLVVVGLMALVVACTGSSDDAAPTETASPTQATTAPLVTSTERAAPSSFENGSIDSFSFPARPASSGSAAKLREVRVGAHPDFDRIVFEFSGKQPAGTIEYATDVVQCGSGFAVNQAGSATLLIRFSSTNAHKDSGESNLDSREISGPGTSILEAEQTCDFEAQVEWAVGTDGEKPFTVSLLQGPTRVVVDVAH